MKVIHLPFNIASQMSVTVRGLRALGVDARGLAKENSKIQDYRGLRTIEWTGRPNPLGRLARGIRWRSKMIRAMAWADVIHWYWGDTTWKELDLKIAAWLRKPRIVEFWGDDVRDPTMAARNNPFVAQMYAQLSKQEEGKSEKAQRMFKRHGFNCLIPGQELADYLKPDIFPVWHQTNVRVMLEEYAPQFPSVTRERPLVVHAPSDKLKKGTEAVVQALANLARTHAFDFKLIHNLTRSEALKIVAECDLFLDQFTLGAEGLATYEAMAFGKPVVCYIKPAWQARYPLDFPIVVATQNTLEEVLPALLNDGKRRHELGRLCRKYVEKYHDTRVVAAGLVTIYEKLLRQN